MTIGVRANFHAPQLISRGPKIYNRVLTTVALKRLELVTIRVYMQYYFVGKCMVKKRKVKNAF